MAVETLRRAVFLDRDGVLNAPIVQDGHPFPPADLRQLRVLPGVARACSDLRDAGYVLVVVTNQPDIARGTVERTTVDAINSELRRRVAIDAIYMCAHDDDDRCLCRKPKPGMLRKAAHNFGIDLETSYMVGDRWRDIEAGDKAGCRTIHIDWGYAEVQPVHADIVVKSLPDATDRILAECDGPGGN